MPLRKDYLLDQLRDFFAALTRIAARIEAGELERAEEEIDALTSADAIGELLGASGPVPEHTYAAWKFQVQLLLLKIRLLEARGMGAGEVGARGQATGVGSAEVAGVRAQMDGVRAQAVGALRKLIALRPEVYDIELAEQLRGLEKS